MQGNNLGNNGVKIIFNAMKINNSLLKLNLADNKFDEEYGVKGGVTDKLKEMLIHNSHLSVLDLRINEFTNVGAT